MKFIFILFLLISCSSYVTYKTPVNRFMSAEAQGKTMAGNLSANLQMGKTVGVKITEDEVSDKLVNDPNISVLDLPMISSNIGIYGPVDAYILAPTSRTTPILGLKWQFYGKPRYEATEKTYSFALFGGAGGASNTQENDESVELSALDEEASIEVKSNIKTFGLLSSYRLDKSTVATLSYFINQYNFHGTFESENTNINGVDINYSGLTHVTSFNMRFELKRVLINFELSHENAKWDTLDRSNQMYANIDIGLYW